MKQTTHAARVVYHCRNLGRNLPIFFVYPAPLIDLAPAQAALIDMPAPEALLTGLFGPADIR